MASAMRDEEDMDVDVLTSASDMNMIWKSYTINDPKQLHVQLVYEHVGFYHQWKMTDLVYHLTKHFCKPEGDALRLKYVYISSTNGIRKISVDKQIDSEIFMIVKHIEKKLSSLWYVEMCDDISRELEFSVRTLTDASCLVFMPYTSPSKRMCIFSESLPALRRSFEAITNEFKQRRSFYTAATPTTFNSGVSTNYTTSGTDTSYPHTSSRTDTSYPHTSYGTDTSYPHTSSETDTSYPHTSSGTDTSYPHTSSGTDTSYPHTDPRSANEDSKMEFEVETLKVKIYQSSILDVKVDTIVNAADEYLTNGSGVSKAIEDAGGYEYQKGCETLLKLHGPTLKTSHVYDSRRGRLRDKFKVILHAIGPRWIDHEDKEQCLLLLIKTVKNVLKMADSLVTTSLAMPAISSGYRGVPVELCAACYILGIFNFSLDYSPKNLKEVHLVDRDPKVVQELLVASSKIQRNPKLISFSTMKTSYPQHFGNVKQTVAKGTSQSKSTASSLQPLDFKMGKLKVKVYQESILNVKANAIVNAANESLSHGAGVAFTISQAAGEEFDEDCQRRLRSLRRSLHPTEVLETVPGNLRRNFKYILNAVGPIWGQYSDKTHCLLDLNQTIKNIMDKAEKLLVTSLAMPAISSGIFGVPLKLCAEMYLLGISEFSQQRHIWVEEVHIVDIDANVLTELTAAYQQYKHDPQSIAISSAKARHPDLMRTLTSTFKGNTGSTDSSASHYGNENETTSAESRNHVKDPKTSKQSDWKNIWKCDDETFGRQLAKVFSFQDVMVIKIYTGSIVRFKGDAIICSNDDRMSGIGPLAKAIAAAGGSKYSDSYSKLRSKYLFGKMIGKAGDVETCSGGDLKVGFVVHAVINSLTNTNRESLKSYKETLKKIFCTINSYKKSRKFSMPLIGAGYFEQKSEELRKCCGALFEVLVEFCRDHQSNCQIKELHLINKNQKVTDALVDLFTCNVSKPTVSTVPVQSSSNSTLPVQSSDATPGYDERNQNRRFHRQHSWSNSNPGGEASGKSVDFRGTGARPKTTMERSKSMYNRRPNTGMVKTEGHNQDIDDLIAKNSISMDSYGNPESAEKKTDGNLVIIGLDDEDDDRSEEQGDEDKTTTCVICMDDIRNGIKLACGHEFCKGCLTLSFTKHKQACPVCGKIFGEITGNQPPGEMTTAIDSRSLPGYEGYGTITVKYRFKSGTQGSEHPNPGKPYEGTERRGFLPDNEEGRKVLKLLKKAFDQRLTFTIGYSRTTGKDNVVTWNDIHHKTKRDTGAQRFGYPDPTYLQRVQEELAAKGVTD